METQGFRHLGDYEHADLKGTPQDTGCFLRVAASGEGLMTGSMYHFRPQVRWLRLIMLVLNRGGMKFVDFQTEFSDGSFMTTSNAEMAGTMKSPSSIDARFLPAKTPPQELLPLHLKRITEHLKKNPELTVREVRTLEDAFAAEERQDAVKAAFRQELGGMTREELFAHATTPAKIEAAEKLWARMQERKKLAGAQSPPPVPPLSSK